MSRSKAALGPLFQRIILPYSRSHFGVLATLVVLAAALGFVQRAPILLIEVVIHRYQSPLAATFGGGVGGEIASPREPAVAAADRGPAGDAAGGEPAGAMDRLSFFSQYIESAREKLRGIGSTLLSWVGMSPERVRDDDTVFLVTIGLVMLIVGVLNGVTLFAFGVLSRKLALQIAMDLRGDICRHLLGLGLSYFHRQRSGDLLSRQTNDVFVTLRGLNFLYEDIVKQPFLLLGGVVFALFLNWQATLVILLVMGVVVIPVAALGRRVRKRSQQSLGTMADVTHTMQQMFSGVREILSFNLEGRQMGEFDEASRRHVARSVKMFRARAGSKATMQFTYCLAIGALFVGSGVLLRHISDVATTAQLAVLMVLMGASYPPLKNLANAFVTLQESAGAADRLLEIFDEKPDVQDRPGARVPEGGVGAIRFDRVSFRYDTEPVLRDVSFEVPEGRVVALVGPSGAGKTTLLDLIPRFYDVTQGAILLDGHDVRDLRLSWLRAQIAVVSQQPFVFHATIGENIRVGRPDATEEEVRDAARAAQVDAFVRELPRGYDTLVGERGVMLSGGQLQRLTIARAILKRAPVLLLDEATSSLDTESEIAIQKALANLLRGRTAFVIAHRLSTVQSVDEILVLDHGRIRERGNHEELIARDGLYRRLHDLQFREPPGASTNGAGAGEGAPPADPAPAGDTPAGEAPARKVT